MSERNENLASAVAKANEAADLLDQAAELLLDDLDYRPLQGLTREWLRGVAKVVRKAAATVSHNG